MHDMQMPMQMPVVWGVRFTRCPGRLLTTHLPCTCIHMQASPGISWWTRCERGSRTRWAAGAGAASRGQVVWELHGMHATVCLHLHPVMCLHLPPLPPPHCNSAAAAQSHNSELSMALCRRQWRTTSWLTTGGACRPVPT